MRPSTVKLPFLSLNFQSVKWESHCPTLNEQILNKQINVSLSLFIYNSSEDWFYTQANSIEKVDS